MRMDDARSLGYIIKRSSHKRLRYVRITVARDGSVVVIAPAHAPDAMIHTFVQSKGAWIREKQEHFKRREHIREKRAAERLRQHGIPVFTVPPASAQEFRAHKEAARVRIQERVDFFVPRYGVRYQRLTIKNQGTRWGSCSARGALSFNYRLLFVPPAVLDYVVVHEVCHLRELNHSDRFWNLVAQEIPAYHAYRQALSDSLG
jgi:predicted metal-dependent hydrolase